MKYNIAIILGRFPSLSETFLVNQINGLMDSGNDVSIYSYNIGKTSELHQSLNKYDLLNKVFYKEPMPSSKIKRFIRFYVFVRKDFINLNWKNFFNSLNFINHGMAVLSLKLFYQSYWFQTKKEFDIIHAHFGPIGVHVARLKEKGFLKNCKFVVTLHGFDINPLFIKNNRKNYALLFDKADLITVNTKYTYELLKTAFPENNKIRILPVGLDTKFFSKDNELIKDDFTILFCGRLIPCKSPNSTILIFKELLSRNHKNIKLIIAGEGEMIQLLKNTVNELGLANKVKLLGALTQLEVKDLMNKSSLLLMPGILDLKTFNAETQGLVIQEAQSMELPVVISNAGGMKYGILDGESGYVVEEGNIQEFANKIEGLILDRSKGDKMGKRGREFVVKNYDNKVINAKLLSIYNSIK